MSSERLEEVRRKLEEAVGENWWSTERGRIYTLATLANTEDALRKAVKETDMMKAVQAGVDAKLESIFESILEKTIKRVNNVS